MKVAGIDVSSKTVTLVIHFGHPPRWPHGKALRTQEHPQDHATLSNRLRKAKVSRVRLEAAG